LTAQKTFGILHTQEREKKMSTEKMMSQFPITRNAWNQVSSVWKGIAIPCQKTTADGGMVQSEKVLKFSRSGLRELRIKSPKADPRLVGGEDRMRFPVGKPGSPERVAALAAQYASLSEEETSPFEGE
jgi:hypothetical protein